MQAEMASNTKQFKLCSLLMASLFAASAAVQLDDPDWYLWLPLYAFSSYVNLMGCWAPSSKGFTIQISKAVLWLALFLFIKVVREDHASGIAGFWSVDMRERVVREKIGSGLVMLSMILHLTVLLIRGDKKKQTRKSAGLRSAHPGPSIKGHQPERKKIDAAAFVKNGMMILVCISYGLSFLFLAYHAREMKF